MNIFNCLLDNFGFEKTDLFFDSSPIYKFENLSLVTIRQEIVRPNPDLDIQFGFSDSYFVFVSRHRAESGIPSLTGHFTGNFGAADSGGNSKEMSRYCPSVLKRYMIELQSLKEKLPSKYNVTLEATHHGPTELKKPLMFVELGSSETEWGDKDAATQIAAAIVRSLSNKKEDKRYGKCAIGLGGTHYPEKFSKLEFLDSEIAMGAIVPKYSLQYLDERMMKQIIEKSEEKISIVALDWKGLGKEKSRINELVNSFDLEILKL
jgi:D-aminoacyl-tRNA deacylase